MAHLDSIEDLNPYLGKLNGDLYNKLNAILPVQVNLSSSNSYKHYTDDVHAHVYVTEEPNPALFAYMLLHLQLYYDHIVAGQYFKNQIRRPHRLFNIMSIRCTDEMVNDLESVKIYPRFLKMGYKQEETPFFDEYRIDEWCFRYYKENYYKPIVTWQSMEYFIYAFIRMKSDKNPAHSYQKYYSQIQATDPNLFAILVEFWAAWELYDIDQKWTEYPPFVPIIMHFADSLENHLPEITNKIHR